MSVIYGPPIWEKRLAPQFLEDHPPGSALPRLMPPSLWFQFRMDNPSNAIGLIPFPLLFQWPAPLFYFLLTSSHAPPWSYVFWNYSASSYFFSNFNFHSFILTPRTPFPWPCWALQSLRASTGLQGSFWPSLTQFFHTLQTHPAGRSSINFDCLFCSYTQAAKHSWENNTIT